MDIKILVATHKKYWMPEDDVYLPIHVGREGKADLGYVGDNTGDNISEKNANYCELTGLYWAWKNLKCDYIGLCHYRRYFAHTTSSSDTEKKKLYDQYGFAAFEEGSGNPYGAGGQNGAGGGFHGGFGGFDFGQGGNGYHEYHFENSNMGDMGDIFGDIFGNMFHGQKNSGYSRQSSGFGGQGFHSGFGGSGFGGHTQEKGSDLRSEVSISFEDAAFGCDKMIRLSDPSVSGSQTLQVHVPAAIENGKSIRLKGKGNPGFNGGEAGDLLLKVNIQPKPGYERNGMDVYTTTEIPFTTAVFGGEAKVSTLYGDVICRIPEGAQTGRKIRLKGKGIVSMKNPSVHGDQYVTIRIQVPQNLSPEAKEKLREFQQVCRNDERKRRGSVA